jgi:hypothetical protein
LATWQGTNSGSSFVPNVISLVEQLDDLLALEHGVQVGYVARRVQQRVLGRRHRGRSCARSQRRQMLRAIALSWSRLGRWSTVNAAPSTGEHVTS